jgi:phosphoribosylformylglycinamidine synthase
MRYKADIVVTLKGGVRDPQGSAIETVLKRTGMEREPSVAVGKYFSVAVNGADEQDAKRKLEEICREVLSNPILEKYEIERFCRVN